ncbi:hypothetical protein YA0089_26790 [Pseudomonas viridiflava]|uniref:hypothetical protein n=1 Tax=Pseudomonas viridiflava TaxID=33069 RepID=UPI0018E62CAB|nr:hypothetical protein [Pseudomonas viridiflava]MBI6727226.1 hypothetical protein [Pseudomonas viridiflava]
MNLRAGVLPQRQQTKYLYIFDRALRQGLSYPAIIDNIIEYLPVCKESEQWGIAKGVIDRAAATSGDYSIAQALKVTLLFDTDVIDILELADADFGLAAKFLSDNPIDEHFDNYAVGA